MVILALRKLIAREKHESGVANFPSICFAKAQGYCYARVLADKKAKASQPPGCISLKPTAVLQYLADVTTGDQLIQMYLN